jgi:hypothetical protein
MILKSNGSEIRCGCQRSSVLADVANGVKLAVGGAILSRKMMPRCLLYHARVSASIVHALTNKSAKSSFRFFIATLALRNTSFASCFSNIADDLASAFSSLAVATVALFSSLATRSAMHFPMEE